jgi:hypothetical protein
MLSVNSSNRYSYSTSHLQYFQPQGWNAGKKTCRSIIGIIDRRMIAHDCNLYVCCDHDMRHPFNTRQKLSFLEEWQESWGLRWFSRLWKLRRWLCALWCRGYGAHGLKGDSRNFDDHVGLWEWEREGCGFGGYMYETWAKEVPLET